MHHPTRVELRKLNVDRCRNNSKWHKHLTQYIVAISCGSCEMLCVTAREESATREVRFSVLRTSANKFCYEDAPSNYELLCTSIHQKRTK